jgi:rod shape determining protein RodA
MLNSDVKFADGESLIGQIFRRLRLDPALFVVLMMLIAVGLLILYSASGQSIAMLLRQGIRLMLGMVGMLVFAQLSMHKLRMWSPWLYAGGILCLLLIFLIGDIGKGAQRWLDLGIVRFQPSELMKLIVPMTMAWYLSGRLLPPRFKVIVVATFIFALPMALIAKQPDLGTALLVGSAGFMCLFLAGMSWWWILSAGVLACAAMPLAWNFMHAYQKQRVLTFLNPESDPLGAGYHIIQSKIAIGSGGVYGKGWLNGTQSHLDFLPERSTDFIFSVLAEEFGLFGVLFVLALYGFIVIRGLRIASRAKDGYGRIVAGSITLTFFVYLIVNVGMVSGLLPVVGVPLPLVSYGGTAIVTLLIGFGLLMSVNADRRFGSG